MAPALGRGTKKSAAAPTPEAPPPPEQSAVVESKSPVAMVSPQEKEFRAKLKELRDHLTKNAENVGGMFPEEARKMHYGEIEHRSIYGEASPDQAKELHDEGIEFHPLPVLPDDSSFVLLDPTRRVLILPHGGQVRADQSDPGSTPLGPADITVRVDGAARGVVVGARFCNAITVGTQRALKTRHWFPAVARF